MRSFLLLALLAAPMATQAQAPRFGVKGGLNIASASFEFADLVLDFAGVDKVQQLGFVGGVTADIPFSSSFGLRAEVLYTQKGYGLEVEPNDRGISLGGAQAVQLDYLEVPVLLTRPFLVRDGVEIATYVGIAPAFTLNESFVCSDEDQDPENACADSGEQVSGKSTIKAFDLGVAGGIGIGAGPFSIEGRYTFGITRFNVEEDDDDDDGLFGGDAHNSVFSIAAVYRFGR